MIDKLVAWSFVSMKKAETELWMHIFNSLQTSPCINTTQKSLQRETQEYEDINKMDCAVDRNSHTHTLILFIYFAEKQLNQFSLSD